MKSAFALLFVIREFARSYVVFPKPKYCKRLYFSVDDFLKLIPEGTKADQAVKLFKQCIDLEKEKELLKEVFAIKLKRSENELAIKLIDYEIELKEKKNSIKHKLLEKEY